MKQIIQSFKTGETILEELPVPVVKRGMVLIKTSKTLVSLGTEKMLVEFGKANLLSKARQQPDKVKMVLDKMKTDGILPTLEAVFNKLEQPLPLGYCNAGVVVEVGEGVRSLKIGDRVASNGQHAEYVCVPENLVAKVPENVSDEEAAFTVIASIGLQGMRLINPTLGETVVVYGLGLIGLLSAQLLKANGCRVIGIDLDTTKLEKAATYGIETISGKESDPAKAVLAATDGVGADAVLICASAPTNNIIKASAHMSRKRGRIVLVGVIGLEISRADFYEKELSFQVSCSYGPGRYDDAYEQQGKDYPLPFVRWTEKRNFEAVLQTISDGGLKVSNLITEDVPLEDFQRIYKGLGKSQSIASIISYSGADDYENQRSVEITFKASKREKGEFGIIGAGNFTKMTMLPAMKKANTPIKYIASSGGVNGNALAKKFHITKATTDIKEILNDKSISTVVIATRHNLHASMVIECLKMGKSVFVEKPLALTSAELVEITKEYEDSKLRGENTTIDVGFNRRFSPHAEKIKQLLGKAPGAINITATMNAGFIPENVWVHDMNVGGGRIVGEACHLIDLISFLTGSKVASVCMNAMGKNPLENTDNASILLKYENGSNGVINYFANGSKSYAKERVEVFSQERTIIMDNFRITKAYGFKGFSKLKTKLDKGHLKQFELLTKSTESGEGALIPFDEIINTTNASFAAIESLKTGSWIDL